MKNFTKEDLKPGMLIESRGMGLRMVMPYGAGYLAFVDQQGFYWAFDDDLKLDLTDSNCSEFDIMKVYGYSSKASESMRFDTHNRELLWKREEESEKEYNDKETIEMYVKGKKLVSLIGMLVLPLQICMVLKRLLSRILMMKKLKKTILMMNSLTMMI